MLHETLFNRISGIYIKEKGILHDYSDVLLSLNYMQILWYVSSCPALEKCAISHG